MKRRLRMLVLVLVLSAASFRVPASAVAGANSAATRADFTATVDIDGNCLVTMQLSLHLDKEEENLYFPLPGTAANITIKFHKAKIFGFNNNFLSTTKFCSRKIKNIAFI